ncbi:MAG: DUF4407 domain-containing protein [Chitinophagaceae bacterium]|nr:DUF4407 domain-containing protein [Chitinophagaceae bacterium]
MLKYYSLIIGENPEYTKTFQPGSKRKIALYANCMMVPVILWFISTFLLIRHVLEGSIFYAFIAATISSLIIFLIERSIIMSNGSKLIFWFRILLGFLVASLGSISMDEVIFKHDIDNQVAKYKQDEINKAVKNVEEDFSLKIANQQAVVAQKRDEWNQALKDAKSEADGTGGSGRKGVDGITRIKMSIASKLEADYISENLKLSALQSNLESERNNAKLKAESDFNGNALLIRIKAMFDLIAQDKFMMGVYILFTLFLFCLELLVVLIKAGSKNSIDEDLEKAREALLIRKIEKILARSELFYKPENSVTSVQQANAMMRQNSLTIF